MTGSSSPYMYIAYLVLGLTSCSANAILIWIIVRNREFLTVSNIIIVSLASSDFMLGIIVSPMEMIHHLLPDVQIVGYGCIAHQSLMIFVPLVSIVHLLLVAIERFIKIVYPLHYQSIASKKKIIMQVVIAWTLPLFVCLLPFAGVHKNMGSNSTDTGCSSLDLLPCPYLFCIMAVICAICIALAVLYSKIVKIAIRHARDIRAAAFPRPTKSTIWRSSEMRAISVLLMTVSYFVLSWAPFSVCVVEECITKILPNYYTITVFIAYFNSTVNPLIYGIGNREIRHAFFSVCCGRKRNQVVPALTGVTNITVTAATDMVESKL